MPHTPGPWKIVEYGNIVDNTNTKIRVSGISMPCGYVDPNDESYANGRLLAAAPDLLEACKQARNRMWASKSPTS